MNINEMLRAQHISRWTIVATTRPQSLAEHTFNVTMLCRDFCRRLGISDLDMQMLRLMHTALDHDMDEVFTGDIPTPAKALLKSRGADVNSTVPELRFSEELENLMPVLKCLDILESIHFLKNFGTGDRAAEVYQTLLKSFREKADTLPDAFRKHVAAMYGELVGHWA